jgi:hypothetical protein
VISGTPDNYGSPKLTIGIADSTGGAPVTKVLELSISQGVAISTPPTLGDTMINVAYTKPLTAVGGTGPYTWNLPVAVAGWAVDGAGNLTGTPNKKGAVSISVRVVDSTAPNPMETTKTFTINVVERQLAPPPSPDGDKGAAYPEQTLAPAGGTPPYSNYHVDSGALPPGSSHLCGVRN